MTFKKGLITQNMAGSVVLIDPEHTDVIVKLNETSARIFELLHTCVGVKEAAAALLAEYDITEEKALHDVCAIKDRLIELGLAAE